MYKFISDSSAVSIQSAGKAINGYGSDFTCNIRWSVTTCSDRVSPSIGSHQHQDEAVENASCKRALFRGNSFNDCDFQLLHVLTASCVALYDSGSVPLRCHLWVTVTMTYGIVSYTRGLWTRNKNISNKLYVKILAPMSKHWPPHSKIIKKSDIQRFEFEGLIQKAILKLQSECLQQFQTPTCCNILNGKILKVLTHQKISLNIP
jgi:hypothetical protein